MRQVLRQLTILFSVSMLLGLGCKKETVQPQPDAATAAPADAAVPDARLPDAPLPDAGPKIPEGWKVYENTAQGVKIAYPGEWYAQERSGELGDSADYLAIDFNDEPVFSTETEPYYLEAMLFVRPGTLEEALQIPQEVMLVSQTAFAANGLTIYNLNPA